MDSSGSPSPNTTSSSGSSSVRHRSVAHRADGSLASSSLASSSRERLASTLRSLDAFPKVERGYRKTTRLGGGMTLAVGLLLLLLSVAETGRYLTPQLRYAYLVDTAAPAQGPTASTTRTTTGAGGSAPATMQLNIDMTVASPCDSLVIDVTDVGGNVLSASRRLSKQSVQFNEDTTKASLGKKLFGKTAEVTAKTLKYFMRSAVSGTDIPQNKLAAIEQSTGKPACRISGSIEISKVAGIIQVVGAMKQSFGHVHVEGLNFGHIVDVFSFGKHFPGIVNPLDNTVEITASENTMYQYFISVVPTTYVDSSENVLQTNQYAVTNYIRDVNHEEGRHGHAGIFIKYDIESLLVRISEERVPFLHFLTRISGIIGGVFVCTEITYRMIRHMWNFVTGSR